MAGRAPDHKLIVKVPHEFSGKTVWLPVGTASLWVDKEKRAITGSLTLNHMPGVTIKLFTEDPSYANKVRHESEPSMPVDDAPF